MIGVFLIIQTALAATPAGPVWPNTFWQPFSEKIYYGPIEDSTTGTYYYDWTKLVYRIDRSNGQYDRYCGILSPYSFDKTPCTHYVVGGNRYLYYPDYKECCYCCNDTQGCGVLKPTWMQNATFIDTEVHNGVSTYKWDQKGNQDNFIYETVDPNPLNRVTVSLYQVPDDYMDFGSRSTSIPAGTFTLPSVCSLTKYCESAACVAVRDLVEEFQETIF
jgi:hypothetical protein